ncbi:MAG: tetratricopeptide repeat protein, partial [Gammaproteobacteria bacterium]
PYVVLSTDEDIIEFRRSLSNMLEQYEDFIKELLQSYQKNNQQYKSYYKSKLDWHIAAANKKCQLANVEQYYLAQAYENGDISLGIDTPSKKQAFYWYEIAAKNNYCNAQIRLAQAYEYGNILNLKKNLSNALSWYIAAASEKCQDANVAQFRLARAYEDGELLVDGIIDHKKALLYYLKAAHNDHYDAQYYLAILYKFGDRLSVNREPYKALYWYMRAADNGFDNANIAEYELGQAFRYGDDWLNIELDLEEALYWYKRAITRSIKYNEKHRDALKAFNDLTKQGYKPSNKSQLRLMIKEQLINKFN